MRKFGIIYPWPGGKNNAEYEIIKRLQFVAKQRGDSFSLISNEGMLLDDNGDLTSRRVAHGEDFDFVLALHYSTAKIIDSCHYYFLWNPTEFLFPQVSDHLGFGRALSCSLSHDVFLSSNSDVIAERLRPLAAKRGVTFDEQQRFYPSAPDYGFRTQLNENFSVFYCGINWESYVVGSTTEGATRFGSIFKELDNDDIMAFYGPEELNGRRPWEGYQCYREEIPFDGKSLISEINKCGVGLALMSAPHHDSGMLLSNRVHEILASGSVLICHYSDFLYSEFGDDILYLDYQPDDVEKTVSQIRSHIAWIKENITEARKKAENAQQKWLKRFELGKQLDTLITRHDLREEEKAEKAEVVESQNKIDVLCLVKDEKQLSLVELCAVSLSKQSFKNLNIIFVCDNSVSQIVSETLDSVLGTHYSFSVCPISLRRPTPRGVELITEGEMVCAALRECDNEFISVLSVEGLLWRDHFNELYRVISHDPSISMCYSGTIEFDEEKGKRVCFDPSMHSLMDFRTKGDYVHRNNYLMRKELLCSVPEWIVKTLDTRFGLFFMVLCSLQNKLGYTYKHTVELPKEYADSSWKDFAVSGKTEGDILIQLLGCNVETLQLVNTIYAPLEDSSAISAIERLSEYQLRNLVLSVITKDLFPDSSFLVRSLKKIYRFFCLR